MARGHRAVAEGDRAVAGRGERGNKWQPGAVCGGSGRRHKDGGFWAEEGKCSRSEEGEVRGRLLWGGAGLRGQVGEWLGEGRALQTINQLLQRWPAGQQLLLHLPCQSHDTVESKDMQLMPFDVNTNKKSMQNG